MSDHLSTNALNFSKEERLGGGNADWFKLIHLHAERGKDGGLGGDNNDHDDGGAAFDIAVEDALSSHQSKRSKPSTTSSRPSDNKDDRGNKPRMPRSARDSKFGFGSGAGKKGRREKQNTRESTNDFGGDRGDRRGGAARRGGGGGSSVFRNNDRGGASGGGSRRKGKPGQGGGQKR